MALTDINFQEGDRMTSVLEIPQGTLNAPVDILVESGSTRYLVLETALIVSEGGGDNIFIMSE
jgi:hypothetical protein